MIAPHPALREVVIYNRGLHAWENGAKKYEYASAIQQHTESGIRLKVALVKRDKYFNDQDLHSTR